MSIAGLIMHQVRVRRSVIGLLLAVLLVSLALVGARSAVAAVNPCGPPVVSVIACENTLPGDPPSDWQVSGAGDSTIQGFATAMSVNVGQTENFKINTPAKSYHIDILRVGYYQGNGARKVVSNMLPTATLPQSQPACKTDSAPTGLIDCGNWAVSVSWAVPTDAVSGLYLAHLVRNDTGGSSLIPFVVRNDASQSDILFQTSDETWQAYNTYGGNSLYTCGSNCPAGSPEAYKGASKVSYNRPWHSGADDNGGRSWFMYAEYPMIRFMEANGYDMSYTSGVDMSQPGAASIIEQHKIFLSVGHDEYWSGQQRANVVAARDAGVNLAFFSGNEVFWKTRWEPSIDGSNTPSRTLVAYKETHYDAPTDPQDPPTWTGTWMDPRFSPPGDGGNPQNALSGQLFDVNSGTTDITVQAQYSKIRFWRNTRVASLSSGQSTTLDAGVGTLGYEWDVDADNGFRPPGLMDMSSTTSSSAEIFTDYGSNTKLNSTATHHLTLYRAPSGALVFGAGTVQWSWGLDNSGDGGNTDQAMRQATVNLFADMGAQPFSLISGLTPATASTDTTPPTSSITSPSQGATLSDGSAATISGTATDTGGGVVAGVEISMDGGATWRPVTTMSAANTSVTWTYSWVAHGNPSTTIRARAVDDSGNLEKPGSGITVNVKCPCSIWGTSTSPKTADSGDSASIEVGVKFKADTYGYITGIRFYKASTNTGTHIGNLWTAAGQLLARATFTGESGSGWQQVTFAQPVPIDKNTTYVASYFAPKGHYSQDGSYFYTTPPMGSAPTLTNVDSPPLRALRNTNGTVNGVYSYASSSTFPTSSTDASNYWVDSVFTPETFNNAPGQVINVSATAGYASANVTWSAPTSGDPVTAYTITPYIGSTAQTPTTVTGNPAPTSAVVSGLSNGTTYTFTVTPSNPAGSGPESAPSNSVTPSSGIVHVINGGFENGLTGWTTGGADPPAASGTQFHSGSSSALLGVVQPAQAAAGDSNVSQTVAIPSSGKTTLSFWYRPATADDLCSGSNCHYDWQEAQVQSTSGQTLASIFKSNSNSQTWTQVSYDMTPYAGQNVVLWLNVHQDVSSSPDDTWMYVDDVSLSQPSVPGAPTAVTATAGNGSATVSWTAPSDNGGSAITSYTVTPYIGSTAQTPVTVSGSPPATTTTVTGLTNGTTYTFTVSATNANGTGPASSPSNAVTPDAPPTVTSVTPSAGATGVSASVAPTATFSQAVVPSTASFILQDSSGNSVAGSVSFNSGDTVATFTPTSSLAASTTFTATVSGAQDSAGTPMSSPFSWSFTTAGPACPCSIWQNGTPSGAADAADTSAVNLGLKFQASSSGYITAVRFYKESDNTGAHTGSLWTATGTLLASGTFSNESTSGWQELDFSSPVPITANTTYVASYHTNTGHYADTSSGLASPVTNGPMTALASGGVYAYGSANAFPSNTYNASNYWVDAVYTQSAGTTPPTVTNVTPSPGLTGVAVSVAPTATFSQAVVPSTVSFTLKDSGGNSVAGSVSFNTGNSVATFTPASSLADSTAYTATVSGAQNSSGTPMSSPYSWNFTTGTVSQCPCSIWQNGTPSGAADAADTSAGNLGLQFQVSSNGTISAVRFYKEIDNTGTHTGSLWTASGTLLATGTFSNETASGWQELDFSSPVPVTAGPTYVASYHTNAGHYAFTSNGLASAVTNGPLTALASGGVYAYGSGNVFPSNSYNASNYWVDVVYSPS
jgi:hypothetical protein